MAGNNTPREHWGSRIGFILAAAGSAVGLGNIWKFPFITGMNGGAAFVLFYLASILIIGLPVMLIEFSIGRNTQLSPVGAFRKLAPGSPWFLVGILGVAAGFIILSYYSVIAGWTLAFIVKALLGDFSRLIDPQQALSLVNDAVSGKIGLSSTPIPWGYLPDSLANWDHLHHQLAAGGAVPDSIMTKLAGNQFEAYAFKSWYPILTHAIFMLACGLIVIKGVKGGIEKWNNILMPTLFVIVIILVIRGLMLPGASQGLSFLFMPDFSKLTGAAMLTALGHAFFTLSLGMGVMVTYGSYLQRHENLFRSAISIIILDTGVALLTGIAIFTAVFSYGFEPAAGPGLVFNVLPGIFARMPGGVIMAVLFFFLLFIAALTSGISLLEVVTVYFIDQRGWSRKRATIILTIVIFLMGVPSALSFGLLSEVKIMHMVIFDFLDYLSFKYLLPIGGFLMVLFTLFTWKTSSFLKELHQGNPRLRLPLLLAIIFLICSAIFVAWTFVAQLKG